jgi:hypothetical protein
VGGCNCGCIDCLKQSKIGGRVDEWIDELTGVELGFVGGCAKPKIIVDVFSNSLGD